MQIFGGAAGDFIATQIIARQPRMAADADATLGVGMSATR